MLKKNPYTTPVRCKEKGWHSKSIMHDQNFEC